MAIITETASRKPVAIGYYLLGWLLFAFLYVILKEHATTLIYAKYWLYLTLVAVDAAAGIYGYRLWRNSPQASRKAILLFALSFFCLLFDDLIYQLLFDILGMHHSTISWGYLAAYNLPYLGFLLFQTLAWVTLLPKPTSIKFLRNIVLYVPIAIIVITTAFLIGFILHSHVWDGQNPLIKFYSAMDSTLQLLGFIAALLCLATTRSKGVFYLALGFLIAVVTDMILTLGFFAQHFGMGSILEASWPMVLLLFICGLTHLKQSISYVPDYKSWVCELSSIRAQFVFWATALLIIVLGIFIGSTALLSHHLFF